MDIATTITAHGFDWQLVDDNGERQLAGDSGLHTAVCVSLFSDARANRDHKLPHNQTDRRGWCGEEHVIDEGEQWGSHLWLAVPNKLTDDARELAEYSAKKSLQHLVQQGVVSRMAITSEWRSTSAANERLALRIQLYKPEQLAPVYDVTWGTTIARGNLPTEFGTTL